MSVWPWIPSRRARACSRSSILAADPDIAALVLVRRIPGGFTPSATEPANPAHTSADRQGHKPSTRIRSAKNCGKSPD